MHAQMAMPGASPNVDSSERSILPTMRMNTSASTMRLIALIVVSTLIRLAPDRNLWSIT